VNPVRSASSTRPWTDTNRDLIPQLSELGPGTGFNIGTTNRYAADVDSPLMDELTVEIERQLFGDLMVSVGFFHRELKRDIGSRNMAVPAAGYVPLQVTEQSSGRAVTVYNQDPATRGRFDVVFDNYPELGNKFNGFDIAFRKRLSNRWMALGGFAYGKNTGDTYSDTSDLNNPNFTFRQGVLGSDIPITFKLSGVYEAPLGIRLSGSYEHYTGSAESTTVQVTSATVALTQVNQVVRVEPNGTTRLPSNNVVHLRIGKLLRFAGRGQLTPALDIFNLTNANTIQSRTTQLGPSYGFVSGSSSGSTGGGILRARMLRFGLGMTF
jgi:hypothetical protein